MKPTLFLDVDGVLNCQETWRLNDGQKGTLRVCPDRVALLSTVLDILNAQVVLSSTWRLFSDHVDYLRMRAPKIMGRLHEDWRTPELSRVGASGIYEAKIRGDEIADWLSRHPDVTNWAIVDDDADMRADQMSRFVQTSFVNGLTGDHAQRIETILGGGHE